MVKTAIVERLGEAAVLLPGLIAKALAANDRAKLRLTLLQEAAQRARDPARRPCDFVAERRDVGLDDPRFDALISGARALDGALFLAPGAAELMAGLRSDLDAMLTPLRVAGTPDHAELDRRLAALEGGLALDGDTLDTGAVGRVASARRDGPDSVHLLIMDLHRAINRLAAETAVEVIDGAKAHHLEEADRARVRAFMRGLNRTAPLAFGHPGLSTTAAKAGPRLIIQNDIGETDAHVLVLHVEDRTVTVTYTDVHRRRAHFLMRLFGDRMAWGPLAEQAAEGLGDGEPFYLLTGRRDAADDAEVETLLEFLGSRIVFLIDWNKARKALQTFVEGDDAVDLLGWAAARELGHRAFLELGGAELVFEAVRRAAAGRAPYGVRLDRALGEAETLEFLKRVLRESSEGLRAGRSARLIRDEIQADLAQRFESVEAEISDIVVRHLGLSHTLATLIREEISGRPGGGSGKGWLAERAKRLEAKADRLTLQAREACGRLRRSEGVRRLVDEVENAMDALDECAFLMSLAPSPGLALDPLSRLADIVVESLSQMVRAAEAAALLPQDRRVDAVDALQAIDAVTAAEREADTVERAAIGALMSQPTSDARALVLGLEMARMLEAATDHLAHASLALRERVLEELAA